MGSLSIGEDVAIRDRAASWETEAYTMMGDTTAETIMAVASSTGADATTVKADGITAYTAGTGVRVGIKSGII